MRLSTILAVLAATAVIAQSTTTSKATVTVASTSTLIKPANGTSTIVALSTVEPANVSNIAISSVAGASSKPAKASASAKPLTTSGANSMGAADVGKYVVGLAAMSELLVAFL